MSGPIDSLLDLFDLERLEVNLFRGVNPGDRPRGRVFGGQVASQALRAAAATVTAEHAPHSLHGYFLRPGEPGTPIVFTVDRIRDGRSFTTRRVVAIQHGEAIFALEASFHQHEDEEDEHQGVPLPTGPPPPPAAQGHAEHGSEDVSRAFDVADLGPSPAEPGQLLPSMRRLWVRTRGALPDDPALHASVLTYISDMGVVSSARVALGLERHEGGMGASLDHALWFHRPIRADDWVLFDLRPASTSGARTLVHGTIHAADGVHGVSIAQEALIRRPRRG